MKGCFIVCSLDKWEYIETAGDQAIREMHKKANKLLDDKKVILTSVGSQKNNLFHGT
ncbi:hypothetical protein EGYY_03760 [Eggerthella sp. YY7918]|nr:hypothetical protein EGYY_03760 [Eggerthella sp. YY7918]